MDLAEIEDPIEQYETMSRVAQTAERLGFESIWLFDHFHTYFKPVLETTFECWTSTAALARDTKTIRLGQMVTCNSYRNPALMAKMASTVDVLSHGRLDFGIGAGWYEHEYLAYGYDFPPTPGARLRMLDEALQVITAMWTEPYASFEGNHYKISGAINEPKGVQKPHPPIWIGGSGEKVTLKLAAKYGDATNLGGNLDDMTYYTRKYDVIRGHCEAIGRDPDTLIRSANIETTLLRPGDDPELLTRTYRRDETLEQYRSHAIVGGPQEVVDTYGRLIDAGVNYIIVSDLPGLARLDVLEYLAAEVLPAFR
jgi:F420-dependent oxidoreductase-like protein